MIITSKTFFIVAIMLLLAFICILVYRRIAGQRRDRERIIKRGYTTDKKFKATCPYCNCEFVYTDSEYQAARFEIGKHTYCPYCKSRIIPANSVEITEEEYFEVFLKNKR